MICCWSLIWGFTLYFSFSHFSMDTLFCFTKAASSLASTHTHTRMHERRVMETLLYELDWTQDGWPLQKTWSKRLPSPSIVRVSLSMNKFQAENRCRTWPPEITRWPFHVNDRNGQLYSCLDSKLFSAPEKKKRWILVYVFFTVMTKSKASAPPYTFVSRCLFCIFFFSLGELGRLPASDNRSPSCSKRHLWPFFSLPWSLTLCEW